MYLFSMHIDIIHYVHLKHFHSGLSDVQFENKELNVVHDHLLEKKTPFGENSHEGNLRFIQTTDVNN